MSVEMTLAKALKAEIFSETRKKIMV